MDLLSKQEDLQKEAKEVLSKLNLIDTLSKYGSAQIIGSVALGLMVYRDIDIEVTTNNFIQNSIESLVNDLLQKRSKRIDFVVLDNLEGNNPNAPQGIYIGLKYFGLVEDNNYFSTNPKVWKIDIWFVSPENTKGPGYVAKIKYQLTSEKKRIILEIKKSLVSNPKYKKEIFSIDIYTAVLDKQIKNTEEFKDYLKSISKSIQ